MEVRVLREMSPKVIRENLSQFAKPYVLDWDQWLQVGDSNRVNKFASILRRWQGTRPLPMRRPKAEAKHNPPYIEELIAEATPHLQALGDLTLTDLALATPDQINALHGLWATFSQLPQRSTATCVGITKAIMLLTGGRIGPAFDSIVREKLGFKHHLKSSEEWIEVLRGISEDILCFEKLHGVKLAQVVPVELAAYQVGRLYDMVLGPGTSPLATKTVEEPMANGPFQPSPEKRSDHELQFSEVVGQAGQLAAPASSLITKVNIQEKLALFHDHWNPRIVGELNGQHVKLVKFQGEFVWHKHDHEDELFLVIKGRFRMEFRDRHVWLEEGEFLVVPRGVEHRPVAEDEIHVMLFEPAGTLNTGTAVDDRTVVAPERI